MPKVEQFIFPTMVVAAIGTVWLLFRKSPAQPTVVPSGSISTPQAIPPTAAYIVQPGTIFGLRPVGYGSPGSTSQGGSGCGCGCGGNATPPPTNQASTLIPSAAASPGCVFSGYMYYDAASGRNLPAGDWCDIPVPPVS